MPIAKKLKKRRVAALKKKLSTAESKGYSEGSEQMRDMAVAHIQFQYELFKKRIAQLAQTHETLLLINDAEGASKVHYCKNALEGIVDQAYGEYMGPHPWRFKVQKGDKETQSKNALDFNTSGSVFIPAFSRNPL